jgi:hypothetical protein
MASSMKDLLKKLNHPTLMAQRCATSSPVSEVGSLPASSPGGVDLSGQPASPASPLAQQESDSEQQTPGISGPSSGTSSPSACLQSSLESRLRAKLEGIGSITSGEI